MILLPSRRITKPQAGGSVDIQRAYDTGTFYLSFADASFTDRIGGGVVRNPGGLSLGPNGRIATFNGAQQGNSPLWLNGSYTGIIVAARVRATAAQAGTPGAAFGVYDGTSQGGFGVGFDPSGNAGAALLTSGGAYLSSSAPVGLNKWVTVFAQITGGNAGFSYSYVDGKPATTGQGASYAGDPRSPNEIAYGAQHRSAGFLRQFKGDIEWAAVLRVSPPDGGNRSLTDQLALDLYQSGYPYNLINTKRRTYFDMGAGGGGTSTVTSDLLSSYNIRGAVAADSSHDYSVRGAVAADSPTGYDIRGAVAAPIGAAYDIRGSVFENLGAGYDVRGSAAANLGASYDVRGSAITDLSASYLIRGAAGADSDVSYAVRGAVHATASPAYDIRGSVTSDLSAAYDILSATSVVADSACAYSIRGTAYATTSPAYDIRGAAGSDLPAAYNIRSATFADLPTSYAIEAGVASVYADLTTSYFIDGAVHSGGLSPSDLAAIRAELAPELAAIFQIQTKVDAAL